jgi:hypothetical protein
MVEGRKAPRCVELGSDMVGLTKRKFCGDTSFRRPSSSNELHEEAPLTPHSVLMNRHDLPPCLDFELVAPMKVLGKN